MLLLNIITILTVNYNLKVINHVKIDLIVAAIVGENIITKTRTAYYIILFLLIFLLNCMQ